MFSVAFKYLWPVLLMVNQSGNAQKIAQQKIDSLLKIIPASIEDSNKVNQLVKLSFYYRRINPILGIESGNNAITLASKLNYIKGVCMAYNSIGANYWVMKKFINAQENYLKSLNIAEQLKDSNSISKAYNNMGVIYYNTFNFEKSLEYLHRSIQHLPNTEFNDDASQSYSNIAYVYELQNNYPMAIRNYKNAVAIAKNLKNHTALYSYKTQIGLLFLKANQFDSSLCFLMESNENLKKLNARNSLAESYGALGDYYHKKNLYSNAIINYNKSIALYKSLKTNEFNEFLGIYAGHLGKLYKKMAVELTSQYLYKKNHYLQNSEYNLKIAIKYIKYAPVWNELCNLLQEYAEVKKMQGDFKSSLNIYKEYAQYKDSLFNADLITNAARLTMDYEFNKQSDSLSFVNKLQKNQMERLQQSEKINNLNLKQQWFIFISIAGILLLIAGFLFFRSRIQKIKSANEKLKMEESFNNTLNQTQVEIQEQTFNAISCELHDNVGQLLNSTKLLIGVSQRKIENPPESLATAETILGTAINELRSLSKLLNLDYLQQFNFIENLQTEVNRVNSCGEIKINFSHPEKFLINNDAQIVLFRIVQEALQNAIKHSEATIITINISEKNNGFNITISDNGKGFASNENPVKGIGLSNMKKRTQLLGGIINWDTHQEAGTKINIFIPLKNSSLPP